MHPLPPASFDTWTSGFLIFAVLSSLIGLLLAIQAILTRRPTGWLAAILFVFALTLTDYVLFWTGYFYQYPLLLGLTPLLYFLYGPLLFIYLNRLAGSPLSPSLLLHFLPFLVLLLWKLPVISLSIEAKHALLATPFNPDTPGRQLTMLIPWASVFHLLLYTWVCFRFRNSFSEFPLIKQWTGGLAGGLCGIAIACLSYLILAGTNLITTDWDYMISLVMVLCILGITTMGFLQPAVFNDLLLPKEPAPQRSRYQNSPLNPALMAELAETIHQRMMEGRLWRRSELRLDELAAVTGIQRHYLSQILNDHYQKNFFEFVNQYRVEEAIQLFHQIRQDTPAIDIGYQVGFNNKVSFTRAFRQITGKTPASYKSGLIRPAA